MLCYILNHSFQLIDVRFSLLSVLLLIIKLRHYTVKVLWTHEHSH